MSSAENQHQATALASQPAWVRYSYRYILGVTSSSRSPLQVLQVLVQYSAVIIGQGSSRAGQGQRPAAGGPRDDAHARHAAKPVRNNP